MNDASGTERMAQLDKAVLQALELLERGDAEAARDELLRVAPATAPDPVATISEQELDAAFADASAEVDQMLDADEVALAAIEATEPEIGEGIAFEGAVTAIAASSAEFGEALPLDAAEVPRADEIGDRFATATMAELLAQQGDEPAATRIRASLTPDPATGRVPDENFDERPSRDRVIHTLESWLSNLRGGARA